MANIDVQKKKSNPLLWIILLLLLAAVIAYFVLRQPQAENATINDTNNTTATPDTTR